MTDLLTRDEPHDTGDIPRPVGEATERLNAYLATAPFPAIRRSAMDITGEVVAYRTPAFTYLDTPTGLTKPGQPAPPRPLPRPGPPPKPSGMGEYRERRSVLYVMPQRRPFAYAGRHRPGWHGQVRRFLSAAIAPLVRAL